MPKKLKSWRKAWRRNYKKTRRLIRSRKFAKKYVLGSLIFLAITTVYWSLVSAGIHSHNADQVVDPALFKDIRTLRGAGFPAAHSELIKWPLFWLIAAFNSSGLILSFVTIGLSLLTVAAIVYIFYRSIKRPLYFGTSILALASVLFLIPAEPYPGALLPLNFAMVTTRNLEYVLYLGGLWLIMRNKSFRKPNVWLAILLFGLLFASDNLFLTTSLLGAALMTLVYGLAKKTNLRQIGVSWLGVSVIGALLSSLIVRFVNTANIATIGGLRSPYTFVHNVHDLGIGVIFSVSHLFTNFGANPAYSQTIVRNIPSSIYRNIFSFGALSLILNLTFLGFGLAAAWLLVKESLTKKFAKLNTTQVLGLSLISSAIVSTFAFVASQHYYAVDARYLQMTSFALFVAAAWRMKRVKLAADSLIVVGLLSVLGVVLSVVYIAHIHTQANQIEDYMSKRNQAIISVLKHHPVDAVVGDYWRVIPLGREANMNFTTMPLDNCVNQRSALSSKAWQLDLKSHSFAYILSLDRSLTDFPNCSLEQVATAYGRPNSSVLIDGDPNQPKELLLFYDKGSNPPESADAQAMARTALLPAKLSDLPARHCTQPTVMNFVAHQDDDLLFMNPNIYSHLRAGDCVRTVYLTAGDAGHDKFYWLAREQGSEAAYAKMLNTDNNWLQRTIILPGRQYITGARLVGHAGVSLLFMHLPDGNLRGEGFSDNHFESLAKLNSGNINNIRSVDGQSSYSRQQLIDALAALMDSYEPSIIQSQSNDSFRNTRFPDHADHASVGKLVSSASSGYQTSHEVIYYLGYPIHELPPNVFDADLAIKQDSFLTYSRFDNSVCQTKDACYRMPTYGSYLERQYTSDH